MHTPAYTVSRLGCLGHEIRVLYTEAGVEVVGRDLLDCLGRHALSVTMALGSNPSASIKRTVPKSVYPELFYGAGSGSNRLILLNPQGVEAILSYAARTGAYSPRVKAIRQILADAAVFFSPSERPTKPVATPPPAAASATPAASFYGGTFSTGVFWIIWNPASTEPPKARFTTEAQARKVAGTMAEQNPGQDFYVLKAERVVRNEPRPATMDEPLLPPVGFTKRDEIAGASPFLFKDKYWYQQGGFYHI